MKNCNLLFSAILLTQISAPVFSIKYSIIASKVVRPSTIFQVVASLGPETEPCRVMASISRDGVAVTTNEALLSPDQSQGILLKVPPDNSGKTANYVLRVEGHREQNGGLVFEHQNPLEFLRQFLSITISTSRVIYNAEGTINMRILFLTTSLKPYEGIVDLYILDPDDYIIRKWNSKELNVGVLLESYTLPEYPKIGFWTIRVVAEGQVEELKVKVEKFYLPQAYELVAVMPSFVLDTDEYIEASIEGAFITERIAKGDIHVRWYAKKVDYYTPLYNDSALYRQEYSHYSKMANIYFNNLFYKQWKSGGNSTFDDPHVTLNPSLPQRPIMQKWTYLRSDRYIHRSGYNAEPFVLYLDEIKDVLGTVENIQVRIEAQMTEFFYNETQHAFAETRILKKTLTTRFLGPTPMVFKPGMPFESQISLMFNEIIPVDQETLQSAKLTLKFEDQNGEFSVQKYHPDNEYKDDIFAQISHEHYSKGFRTNGMLQFKVTPPKTSQSLKITALVETEEFGQVQSSMVAYKSVSENDHFIHVRSSTKEIAVGRYVVFHVKTNFPFEHFDWMVLSKNIIIHSGREFGDNIHPEIKTFSIVTSGEMAPGFHIFVYANLNGKVLSDSAYYPIATINSHPVEIQAVQLKNHLMSSVEITCRGDPGSVFLVSSMRHVTYPAQGSNTITKGLLLENLHNLEVNASNYLHKIASTDIYESEPDDVEYYSAPNHEIDSKSIFQARSLFYFSNYLTLSQSSNQCLNGSLPCFTDDGCYRPDQKCNGIYDCLDKSDEKGCLDEAKLQLEQMKRYRLSRQSRFEDFYDVGDGDWAWLDVNIDEDGEQFYELEVPETPDDFWLSVFSMSKENGIGMTKGTYNTIRPIDFYCEAPDHVHRGESVGLRCNVINRSNFEIESVVVLKGSDSYSFIHVEAYGYVTSFAPRLSEGDHHHFIWLRPESETEVYIPIAIHVEQGLVDVTLELSTQILTKTQELAIEILPEGSVVHKHTSVLLDLKNRANVLQFMNVIVDEDPIIPYEIYRRFVAGSPNAHVTICGDVIGPIFPEDQPVRLETMFPTGHGRFGKGTEYHLFNLGANTWQLHYLRLTNQLTEKFDLAKEVFKQMNIEHSAVMRRFTSQGGVSNWDKSAPSVWLTAWVIRIFSHVSYQDWEDYLYIDPLIVSSGAVWLLNYQSEAGYFTEAENGTLHHAYRITDMEDEKCHIALTAHVLIGLEAVLQNLQGGHKLFVATAKQRGLKYLEKILPQIQDTYQLCLVTYTLALLKSSQADIAYGRLLSDAKDDNGMVYWSPSPIVANRVRYEFNRPYWEAKDYQNNDALAVEATSYALHTLFLMEGGGVTMLQEQIVAWLNTMRLGDGGFISTVDTLVALQALVIYSYNSRIKDITDLSVEVDLPDSNYTETLYFSGRTDIAKPQRIDLENVWGHVNLYARGAGQAVAQLDVNYGVDFEPFKDHPATECFDLKIKEHFHGRNKSEITINSCFKWTLTAESPVSGMAMLVIDIPSGYKMEQPTADQIVKSGQVPEMRDADVLKSGKTIWYFDHIPNVTRCFQHTVRRYFPIANLTRTRQAVILEPLRPERFFVRTFNATSLYILSICEVCGSYQCPYCPHYSGSNWAHISSILVVFITLLHFYSK